ncbi:hypothetical protein ACFVWG_16690 [Kribbella sp. NPDC058245]|uniref:hypothetical protein n=1 Tax=Kribbella sp. NPDC058245 TaxID=3346399 RepID=UPI0036E399D6
MNRRPALALIALTVPLLMPQAAHAAVAEPCLQHPLPTIAGLQWQHPDAAAPAGRFLVGRGFRAGVGDTLVRWHDGVPAEVGITDPDGLTVDDVSDDGQIVFNRLSPSISFRYRDGSAEQLPVASGWAIAQAGKIDNAHGVIIGRVLDAGQSTQRAVKWTATNQVQLLAAPAGFTESIASDIADDGTIVGSVINPAANPEDPSDIRAAYWRPDGTVVVLPKASTATSTNATSISNGVIYGLQDSQPVSWPLGSTEPPAPTPAPPIDTNANGTALYPDRVVQPAKGERLLETKDDTMPGSNHALGLTTDDQVLGWIDDANLTPTRWDCS